MFHKAQLVLANKFYKKNCVELHFGEEWYTKLRRQTSASNEVLILAVFERKHEGAQPCESRSWIKCYNYPITFVGFFFFYSLKDDVKTLAQICCSAGCMERFLSWEVTGRCFKKETLNLRSYTHKHQTKCAHSGTEDQATLRPVRKMAPNDANGVKDAQQSEHPCHWWIRLKSRAWS